MKTAVAHQVPRDWAEILRWVSQGEEVQLTEQDKIVARIVPERPASSPDFLARAKAIWGDLPPGQPLSDLISESRGSGQ